MKKILFSIYACFVLIAANGQATLPDSIELNLLNSPANPAFNLMGISLNSIDRPTDLSSFRLSIQNSTGNFTKLPSNYAIELSPASIFSIGSQTLQKFNSCKFKDVFWQSFSVSFGLSRSDREDKEKVDSAAFTKLGFGIKFSFIRPKWTQGTGDKIDSFYRYQALALREYERIAQPLLDGSARIAEIRIRMQQATDNEVIALNNLLGTVRDSIINVIRDSLTGTPLAAALSDLAGYAQGLKIERRGGFLDFATGMALDFPDDRFDNSMVSKAGAWLTGGYERGNKGLSILGIARYLYQPDKIFADDMGMLQSKGISTFDAGAKLVLSALKGKFALSSEGIYRSVLNKNTIDPSWRLTFNTEYDVGANIVFSIKS